jgi:hypothetical protein
MLLALGLALLTAAAPQDTASRGVIRGIVQSERGGLPIHLAAVEAHDGRSTVIAMAGPDGAYRLRVPAGRQTLRVRHMEHAPLEIEVLVPPAERW